MLCLYESKCVRLFLNGTIKIVHTAPWPHYSNRNVFSDCQNLLYDKSASFRCDGRLFHSPGTVWGPWQVILPVTEEQWVEGQLLTLWRPVLPYGYSYKASCARPGSAIIGNFWHLGTLSDAQPECQSARMSKITNDGLTRSGTGCFITISIWQHWASKG